MTTVYDIQRIRFGLHANVADFTSTPTLSVVECHGAEGLVPRGRQSLPRNNYAADGARSIDVAGVQDLDPITLKQDFYGVNSNTGGAVADWEAKMEQGQQLAAVFGAVGVATASAAPLMTDMVSTTLTASSTVLADGNMVLLETTEDAEVRQITAGGGTSSLTVDRALRGTFTDNSTIIRLGVYSLDTSVTSHLPAYIDNEFADAGDIHRAALGCMAESLELNFPTAGLVEMTTVWHPNSWSDVAAANPTYAAPTRGTPIVVANSHLMIGANAFLVEEAKLSIKNQLRFRAATAGTNGRQGAVIVKKHDAMFTCRAFIGDNASSIGELVDDSGTPSLDALLEESTTAGSLKTARDILFQCGTAAGGVMAIRIPVAQVNAKTVVVDGLLMAELTFIPTRPSSGSKSLYLGVG